MDKIIIPCPLLSFARWRMSLGKAIHREVTPIPWHGMEVPLWWPPFLRFYVSSLSDWPPFSAEKICLSLSHIVLEILGPKVDLIFHQNVSFNSFYAFCIEGFLEFRSYFIDLRSFDPLFFIKPEIRLGPIFYRMLNTATKNLFKFPPPWGGGAIYACTSRFRIRMDSFK